MTTYHRAALRLGFARGKALILPRRAARMSLKELIEVANVVKTQQIGGFVYLVPTLADDFLGILDFGLIDILRKLHAHGLGE